MGIAGVGGLGGGGGGVPAGNKGGLWGGDLVARIEKMGELWALLVHTRVRTGGDSVPSKTEFELHKEFACEGLRRTHQRDVSGWTQTEGQRVRRTLQRLSAPKT